MREAGWKDRILLLLGRLRAVRVTGNSMRPTLEPDDVILIAQPFDLAAGDIVLADHPFKQSVTLIKRVAAIEGDKFRLVGDDLQESTDSRSFGTLPLGSIRGKAVCRVRRRSQ
jgi:nickel-type superoxide dismutase maturation protease